MKTKFLVIVLIGLVFPLFLLGQTPTGYQIKRVIIDAGHGGKDPGAIGTGRHSDTEADLALDVSLKVREYILKYYDNVEVIMTRDSDNFVELRERTKIANEAKADLFISIHCNTNGNASAYGAETYVIGMHKSKANMEVAKRENQVIYLEEDYEENYAGFDPNSPESMIALTMMQSQYLEQSILFANKVQQQFEHRVGRKNRGVKQAGYWVISYTLMPSVLIELGFISNNSEEDFLNSENGKVYMASAIYRAFRDYKTEMEGVDTSKPKTGSTPKQEAKEDPVKTDINPNASTPTNLDLKPEMKTVEGIDYRVQVALSTKKLELKSYNFKGYSDISMIEKNGKYRYFLGHFSNFEDAVAFQRELRKEAFKDAYIVVFYKGKEINLKEAENIINQNK